MIKADSLIEFRDTIRYMDGENISLETVQNALKDCADAHGIPTKFCPDEVESGGFFNKETENCILMMHPQHPNDYFQFCIRVTHQGAYAFVDVKMAGKSLQMNKSMRADAYKQSRKGQSMSFKVGSLIGQGLTTMGKNKAKLEEEQNYYACINDILNEVIS